jgi:hypothetical protein
VKIVDGISEYSGILAMIANGYYIEGLQPSMKGALLVASFIHMITTFSVTDMA